MNMIANKTMALVIGASILSMGVGGAAVAAFNSMKKDEPSAQQVNYAPAGANGSGINSSDDLLSYMDTTTRTPSTDSAFKEETVYVIAGKEGTVQKVIVSDWIRNTAGKTGITDVSDLQDISVLKEGETYTMGGDNTRVWDTTNDDIYYQGSIEKELPVDMKVSYFLDGNPIAPEELLGKSGRVTIRYEYTNNAFEMVEIDGKQEKIFVPFTMLTGALLDNNIFSNVEVSNGKIVNDGSRTVVVGFAFPGLAEDLGISSDKLAIPNSVEISADCVNFSLGMTVTIATTELVNQIDLDKNTSLSDLDLNGALEELTSAMSQLVDGSSKLYDGMCTLLDKCTELVAGVDKLAEGAQKLKDGAVAVDEGAGKISNGMGQVYDGMKELDSHSSDLNSGAKKVFESLLATAREQLTAAGLSVPNMTVDNYADVLNGVINSLDDTAVYQQALDTVTSAVEAKRPYIRSQVTAAVKAEVETQVKAGVKDGVTEKVTAAVREQVTAAVTEGVRESVAEQVILQATGMSKADYDAAVAAGAIDAATQQQINGAIDQQMASSDVKTKISQLTDAQMDTADIRGTISNKVDEQMQSSDVKALISSKVDETMNSSNIKDLIDQNTENQVKKAISETMSGDEVQAKLAAASDGAKKVIQLKASLDSYNTFYLGLLDYTAAVGKATAGIGELKKGTADLKKGTSQVASGMKELCDGILTMKDGLPALIEGVTELRDGSMQISDGLKEFDEKGIQKIVEVLDGDLAGILTRLRATTDVSKKYINFSGIADGMDGTVKFIYKTEEIEG
jgi:putative membrane protein